ncbi:hypothetical protein M5524_17110 [Duganella sp. BuS-21]
MTRVQTPAVRARVAEGLRMAVPAPSTPASNAPAPWYPLSPALSLLVRPGSTGIATRRVAILTGGGRCGRRVRGLRRGARQPPDVCT